MVNFMYQLGLATVPRYLVKNYSECFCEGIFLCEISLYINEILIKLKSSVMWAGHNQSVEGLNRIRLTSLKQEGILTPDCLWTRTVPWVTSLITYPIRFGDPQANYESQFLKTNLSIFKEKEISIYLPLCHGNPLQYSCLENSMDGRAWWAIVHGVAKSQLSDFSLTCLEL